MAYPAGVQTRIVKTGPFINYSTGKPFRGVATAHAARSPIWGETGAVMLSEPEVVELDALGEATFVGDGSGLPIATQDGFTDGLNSIQGWTTTLEVSLRDPNAPTVPEMIFVLDAGPGAFHATPSMQGEASAGTVTTPTDGAIQDAIDAAARAEAAALEAEALVASLLGMKDGVSTKDFPLVQALSGSGVDATDALNVLFQSFPVVTIDGDFTSRATGTTFVDWDPRWNDDGTPHPNSLKRVTLAPGAKLRLLGNNGIRRRGMTKFGGFMPQGLGTQRGQRKFRVANPGNYAIGDWIFVSSNERVKNVDGLNYCADIRQVTNIVGDELTVDKNFFRTMTLGRRVRAQVRSAAGPTNVIPIADGTAIVPGAVIRITDYPRVNVVNPRTVTAVDTSTPGANTLTIDGTPLSVTPSMYISNSAETDFMPNPWVVKLRPAPAFNLHLAATDSEILGRGRYDPTLDPGGDQAAGPMIRFEHTMDSWFSGPGGIGSNPRELFRDSNNIRTKIDVGVLRDIFNTGSSGYLINTTGGSRDGHVTDSVALYRGRHGFTTNSGSSQYIKNFDPAADVWSIQDGTGISMGAMGEPEDYLIEPGEVAYMFSQGLDSHRSGYNLTYVINRFHDNEGGLAIRADAVRVIGHGSITGCSASGLLVFNTVDPAFPASLQAVKITNARGTNVDNFSINGPTIAVDCEASGNAISDSGYGIDFGAGATGSKFYGYRCDSMNTAMRFAGTGVMVFDPIIDYQTVPQVFVETGAGVQGDNKIVFTGEEFGSVGDGETRYFTGDFKDRAPGALSAGTQYGHYIYLPDGMVTTLAVDVSVAASAGGTARLALFKLNAMNINFPSTNVIFAEGPVAVDATGTAVVTLTTPFDTNGGGWYWAAIRADAACSVYQGGFLQNRAVASLAGLLENAGRAFSKSAAAGPAWATWSSLTGNPVGPVIGVGMKLR